MTGLTPVPPELIRDCGLREILRACGTAKQYPAASRFAASLSTIAIGLQGVEAEIERINGSGEKLPEELFELCDELFTRGATALSAVNAHTDRP